jgi:hypothetical protein
MKKTLFLSLLLTFSGLVISQVASAQPPPPPMSPTSVPIDGGLSLLLAAGAGLGAKKAWDLHQK